MARKTIEVASCDLCGREGASSYILAQNTGSPRLSGVAIDLCEEHAAPIEGLVHHGKRTTISLEPVRMARPARAPIPPRKIHSPEELDKLETEYRRKRKS